MFNFKIEIMFFRIGAKPDLLNHGFVGPGLNFLLFFLLFVLEFRVIYDFANRWFCFRRYFNQIKSFFLSQLKRLFYRINSTFDIFSNHPYFWRCYSSIHFVRFFNSASRLEPSSLFANFYLLFLLKNLNRKYRHYFG